MKNGVGIVELECRGDALEGEVVRGLWVDVCVVLGDRGGEAESVEAEAAVGFNGEGGEVVAAVLGSFFASRPLGRRGPQ